jgi:hypothetical protein
MDRQTRNLFLLGIGIFVVVFGGAAILLSSNQLRDPEVPSGAATVVGVVTHVDAQGLGAVSSMTIRTTDGQTIDFVIGKIENAAEFPLGHLASHQATGAPVRVWYRMVGSQRVASGIADA